MKPMKKFKKVPCFSESTMKSAVLEVVKGGGSIRRAARNSNLSYASLRKYVDRYNKTAKENRKKIRYFPNYEVNQVFSKELEDFLEEYLIVARKMHYGLTLEDIKRFSFDLAIKNNLRVPKSWITNQKAGKHWLYGYLRRHPLIYRILDWCRIYRPPIKKIYHAYVEVGIKRISFDNENKVQNTPKSTEVGKKCSQLNSPVVIISLKKQKKC